MWLVMRSMSMGFPESKCCAKRHGLFMNSMPHMHHAFFKGLHDGVFGNPIAKCAQKFLVTRNVPP